MTALETPPPTRSAGARSGFVPVLRSELVKLTSLRSTVALLLAMVLLGLAVSVALAVTAPGAGLPDGPSAGFLLDQVTIGTVLFSQLVGGVLGVLVISGEYSSGTIRPTLAAVPSRVTVLAAKAVVLFLAVTAAGLVATFGSWAVTYPLFAGYGVGVGLGAPGLVLALTGGAVYVGLCAVLGLGVGTILRSVAAGVTTVISVILLVPIVLSVLPASQVMRNLHLLTMTKAGDAMVGLVEPGGVFLDLADGYVSTAAGWLVAVLWAAVPLVVGGWLFRRRDA
ncbi:ABC transporter permease subunit [Auraticoccus monumenti]|uniref:ABC-type transport system involved in multi-copper enzyme maturation, permease component n=1 Tax=Auraticoccus monumenti TaxID=675864 RepID=A0A1G7AJW1_9ACTN|nr:ABC transporter permease subunit [Auraticoccus monumenti]SDE15101.1 ABC-type transport system involved in multi-copper enzyme maturation, permease component [Auraticoccus monumenti]